ncbi:hypothetical protein [Vibrio cholerae]
MSQLLAFDVFLNDAFA